MDPKSKGVYKHNPISYAGCHLMSRGTIISLLLIIGISVIVYSNTLDNGFHYDDEHYIMVNPFLEKWENIPSMFVTSRFYSDDKIFTGHYRPLVYVTYALNKILGGNNPAGYHLVNLAFHVGSAFLVFLMLKTMLGGRIIPPSPPLEKGGEGGFVPLAAALIFAVHPFNSEVVNYITARSSVMSGFFYLLAFYCWVRFREEEIDVSFPACLTSHVSRLTSYVYLTSLLAFLLGMICKEVVITLPIVLLLYDLYFIHPFRTPHSALRTLFNWRTYLPYLPFILAVLIPYLLVRKVQYNVFILHSLNRDMFMHFLTETTVLVKYIKMLIIPSGLSIFHDIDVSTSILDVKVILSIIVLILIGIITFLFSRSGRFELRLASFFSVWFFITLLPTTLIPLNDLFQENRGYLSAVSLVGIIAVVIRSLLRRVKSRVHPQPLLTVVFLCFGLLIIVYSGTTYARNRVWKDEYTLWSDVLIKYPMAYKAYYSLGRVYMDRGDTKKALESFNRAIRIYPMMYQAYNRMGILYGSKGDTESAITMFKKAIELRPDYHKTYYNLGTTYYLNNKTDLAMDHYKKAIEISPHYTEPYMAMAEIYIKGGEVNMAKEMYEKAIYFKPSETRAYYRLGLIYEREGKMEMAETQYKAALRIDPGLDNVKERLERLGR